MIPKKQSLLLFVIALVFSALLIGLPAYWATASPVAQDAEVVATYRGLSPVVQFDVSPPLRDMKPAEMDFHSSLEILDDRATGLEGPYGPQDVDPLVQQFNGPNLIPSPLVSFNGPAGTGATPPDPVGDVGPNHYVAMSNLSFAIYDKSGTLLFGPVANNTLWAGFGGDCQTDNSGDPIVVHDQIADRWILTQFTASGPTYFNCIAVSTTSDPTGSYFRYAVDTGTNFPDYPKYGVWSDGYYISTREFAGAGFAGVGAYALNRAELISGDPTPTIISFLVPPGVTPYNVGDGLLPADLDGSTLPPTGSPEYFVGSMDNGGPYSAPQDALTLWKFTTNWTTPAASTFVLANTIPIAAYDTVYPCSPTSRACLPQPGTTVKIDILSYRQRPTWRLAYRNFGTHESLVTNQSVEAVTNRAGIRWWEIRSPNTSPVIFQEGTYSPDATHRWMGSIAMDQAGNMALGYSASNSSSVFPSLWYTGRLAGDPLGTMPQGEGVIHNGTGSQTSSGNRWGDYTSMNVDPVDDCTFWYINEYYPTTSVSGWVLRIGAFKFPSCGGGPTPTPSPTATGAIPTSTPTPTNTPILPTATPTNTPIAPTATSTPAGRPTKTPTPVPGGTLHVGDLDGSAVSGGNNWIATVTITVHDASENPVAGAVVTGAWSAGTNGSGSCTTNTNGQCSITRSGIRNSSNSVTFTVTNVTKSGFSYNPATNHDPDSDSNGTTIIINKP